MKQHVRGKSEMTRFIPVALVALILTLGLIVACNNGSSAPGPVEFVVLQPGVVTLQVGQK